MAQNKNNEARGSGAYQKRNEATGRFSEVRSSAGKFKGSAAEPAPKSQRVIKQSSSEYSEALKRLADK